VIVADTGAIVALIDRSDRHHRVLRKLYESDPAAWLLPWAILPEVDYLIGAHVGARAQEAFVADLADGGFSVSWGDEDDLTAAHVLTQRYPKLRMGLVDAVVIATATRLKATAIATLDLRHFAAVTIPGSPRLLPRDL
jgi:predicted nucleic acid-binding protein